MENGKNEFDFLSADKHQRFLQIGTFIFKFVWRGMPKLPKITICFCFSIFQERRES